jgi:hypothetical protein
MHDEGRVPDREIRASSRGRLVDYRHARVDLSTTFGCASTAPPIAQRAFRRLTCGVARGQRPRVTSPEHLPLWVCRISNCLVLLETSARVMTISRNLGLRSHGFVGTRPRHGGSLATSMEPGFDRYEQSMSPDASMPRKCVHSPEFRSVPVSHGHIGMQ